MNRHMRIILSVTLVAVLVCGMAGCMAEAAPVLEAGSIVTFGRYPQTEEGTDETPIEWIVLEVDEENRRALLLSWYLLDKQPYNDKFGLTTWEDCSLRSWLNGEFLLRAFNPEEQSIILLTDVDNSDAQGFGDWGTVTWDNPNVTGGNNTQDYIFLLSYAEAHRYMDLKPHDDDNMAPRAAPTAYAILQGAVPSQYSKTIDGDGADWWWLRSPGDDQDSATCVTSDGGFYCLSTTHKMCCIRPAMWISLD